MKSIVEKCLFLATNLWTIIMERGPRMESIFNFIYSPYFLHCFMVLVMYRHVKVNELCCFAHAKALTALSYSSWLWEFLSLPSRPPNLLVNKWPAGSHLHTFSVPSTPQTHWGWRLWLKQGQPTRMTFGSILKKLLRVSAGHYPGWSSWLYILKHKLPLLCLSFI